MTMLADPATDTLENLAHAVHIAWAESKTHQITAWEGYLQVGGLLLEARTRLPADQDYGHWFKAQEFGFSSQWGARLIRLAENRPAVMGVLESALSTGSTPPGVDTLLATLMPPRGATEPGASPAPLNYDPDHLAPAMVTVMVNYKIGPTHRRIGHGHGSGPDRAEWQAQFPMGTDIPDSLVALEPFAAELALHFKQKVRDNLFLTMRA